MTKADLVEQVTASIARTAGPMISKKDCARVVDAFLEAVKEALRQQHNIEVRGFGTFKIRRRKTRMARNPRTSMLCCCRSASFTASRKASTTRAQSFFEIMGPAVRAIEAVTCLKG